MEVTAEAVAVVVNPTKNAGRNGARRRRSVVMRLRTVLLVTFSSDGRATIQQAHSQNRVTSLGMSTIASRDLSPKIAVGMITKDRRRRRRGRKLGVGWSDRKRRSVQKRRPKETRYMRNLSVPASGDLGDEWAAALRMRRCAIARVRYAVYVYSGRV